jgi:hypothetical protein
MKRLLICGLLNDDLSDVVRQHQKLLSCSTGNQLALKFPVHITLRGPFWTDAEIHTLGNILNRVCRFHRRIQVLLNGPVFVAPDLCWLEVDPASAGFSNLSGLHRHFEAEMNRQVILDDVPANHKGDNYRPHITVGWGMNSDTHLNRLPFRESANLIGTLERIAIAGYSEGWPATGNVEVIKSVALDEP